jgi:hypothetical protein
VEQNDAAGQRPQRHLATQLEAFSELQTYRQLIAGDLLALENFISNANARC